MNGVKDHLFEWFVDGKPKVPANKTLSEIKSIVLWACITDYRTEALLGPYISIMCENHYNSF